MTDLVKEWLGMRLGIVMDMAPEQFGTHARDGTLLARVLHSYNVINTEQLESIVQSDNPLVRLRNLTTLNHWLRLIGVSCNDDAIRDIAEGKGMVSIRLFYNVYLNLENNTILGFIQQHLKRRGGVDLSRFEVRSAQEIEERSMQEINSLALPLIEKKHMIDWHRIKVEKNIAQCNIDERFLNFCEKAKPSISLENLLGKKLREERKERETKQESISIQNEIEMFHKNNLIDPEVDENIPYDELLRLQVKALEYDKIGAENDLYSRELFEKLRLKVRRNAANRSFKIQMADMLMGGIWTKLMEAQENEIDDVIVKKLLKQSQYEKQMATKLFQVRNEKKNMAQNRALVEKLLMEEREEEFAKALKRNCDEFDQGRLMNQFLDEKNIELHKRIFADKALVEHENNEDMCTETLDAIIDFAVKAGDYKSENNCVPRKLWNEWKAIFLHWQPIFEVVDGVENILDEEYAREMEEIVQIELERQEVLNDHDIYEYLHLLGPWLIEELCPDIGLMEGDQMVLGYIVHKLLDVKYPLPCTLRPIDLPPMNVAAMVIGVNDEEVIKAVEELISYRDILVISMGNVINFCLEQFKVEMSVVRDIDFDLINKSNATVDELKKKKEVKMEAEAKGDKKAAKKAGKQKSEKNSAKSKSSQSSKSKVSGKSKSKKGSTADKSNIELIPEVININDKNTQTPRRIPDDDPILSPQADLGRRAFEILTLGEQIPDNVLVAMLAEYLKAQENMGGWVIFNYPLTYSQALVLEQIMGGKTMPYIIENSPNLMEIIEDIEPRILEDDSSLHTSIEELRTSKLVPNPHPKPVQDVFKTYFTAYINAKKADTPIGDFNDVEIIDEISILSPLEKIYTDEGINYEFYYRTFDFPTIKKLAKLIIGDMELPLKPSIELFGDEFEHLEMKFGSTEADKLGKGSQSKKTLNKEIEVMVEEVEEVVEPMVEMEKPPIEEELAGKKGKKGKDKGGGKGKKDKGDEDTKEKGEKSKKDKGNKSKKGKEKKGKGSESAKEEEKEQSKLDDTTETIDKKSKKGGKNEKGKKGKPKDEVALPDEFLPKPGECGWVYANLRQPEIIQHALATLWESLEHVYLDDFKQIFLLKRIHYSMIMPYCNYTRNKVIAFTKRPDEKQELVFNFLTQFNEVDEELRTDVEIKSEIHCRTKELQTLLWNICDIRKKEAELERKNIIAGNWVAEEMCYLTNIFMEAFQLECDRGVDTFQLLHDYYISMLNKLPSETRLEKIQISRLELDSGESILEVALTPQKEMPQDKKKKSRNIPSTSQKHAESAAVGQKSIRERAELMKKTIENLLTDPSSNKDTVTPFHDVISEQVNVTSSYIDTLKNASLGIISKENAALNTKEGKGDTKGKGKGGKADKKGKKDKSAKSSKSGKSGKSGKSSKSGNAPTVTPAEKPPDEAAILKEASKKLMQEWEAAILCEANRVQFRLQLLKARAFKDLSEMLESTQNSFFGVYDEINKRFEREVAAVDLLCKVICRAIEDETQIQHELVLEQDRFFVKEKVLLYPDPPPPPPIPVEERITEARFTIAQLSHLMEKLSRAAPSGWLPERAFVYLLADMAACGSEEGDGRLLPKVWSDLTSSETATVVDKIFNDLEFVDWKDFLVYALDLGYPSERELLNLRKNFRKMDGDSKETVTHEEFFAVNFWFEKCHTNDPQEDLRIYLAKEFLFALFQVGDHTVNYTALLLYFCKSDTSKGGFAKALALCTGKRAVITEEEFLLVQDEALGDLSQTSEEIRTAALEVTNEVLEQVLEEAIQQVAGFVIKEVLSVEIDNQDMDVSELTSLSLMGGEMLEQVSDEHKSVSVFSDDETPPTPSPSEETVQHVINLETNRKSIMSLTYVDEFSELGEHLPLTVYVTYEVALNVLTVCLPWLDTLSTLKSDTASLSVKLRSVFDDLAPGQPSVLIYQLFKHPIIEELLETVNKFKICQIDDIISEVINSKVEDNVTKVGSRA